MIVDIDKCLVVGVKQEVDLFFQRAQLEGLFEFLPPSGKKMEPLPRLAQDLLTAIKILQKEVLISKEPYGKEYGPKELGERVIFLKTTLEKYHEEQRVLKNEILAIAHFGEFSLDEIWQIEQEGERYIQFFFRAHSKRDLPVPSKELIYISSDLHADYYLGIHEEPKFFPDFVEMRFEKSSKDLKKRLEQILTDIKLYEEELFELTGYLDFLKKEFLLELNLHHLEKAKTEIVDHFEGQLFSVEAWIASQDFSKALELTKDLNVHLERIAIEKKEKIPTCFKNKGLAKVGEDLLQIYDTPSHTDKDPSLFVFWAFSFFFAIIVADAGYGLLYLAASLFAYYRWPNKKPAHARLNKLFIILSSCCVVWGVFISSYFGIHLSSSNPLKKYSLTQQLILKKATYHFQQKDDVYDKWTLRFPKEQKPTTPEQFLFGLKKTTAKTVSYPIIEEFNNNIMMEMALFIGTIHLIISLLRYLRRNWAAFGWVLAMIGGYLYFPSQLDGATSMLHFLGHIPKQAGYETGLQLLAVGISLATLLALIQRKLRGLEEPLKAIQIFSDVLSYLRLYALSLAGMIMAETFNQLGEDCGYALGFFAIIFGHVVNMGIGIMGGFIHGLRLNFLEWYHYSFEGGGKLFNPLRIFKS